MADLPYQRDRIAERKALWRECDHSGNGYCSVAEIDSVFRKRGFGEKAKMALIHAFNDTCNYGGKERGVSADYIEHGEFRVFLEAFLKKLGVPVVPQAPAKENLVITHPKAKEVAKEAPFTVDLPYQRAALQERKKLFYDCDPNGNGFCSVAEIDAILRRKYGFGAKQKTALLKAFNETKNFGGNSSGTNADYIEHGEFRMFLEMLMRKLGMTVIDQCPQKENLMITHPKLKKPEAPPAFRCDLPYQHSRTAERDKLLRHCDPNGNGFCSVAEIDAVFRRQFGFGSDQKMPMIHAFDATKRANGKTTGPSADYIEHGEFRQFLETLTKKLGNRVDAGKPAADKGGHFLTGAKVGSTRGFITVAGFVVAIPHPKMSKSSSAPSVGHRFDAVSENQHHFREAPYAYASMDKKPLEPYHPNAYRSRLATDDAPVPYKNASAIQMSDGIHTCHKRRFFTTNQTSMRGEAPDPRTNDGTLAESSKLMRELREK